jgi:hypothetical protein
MGQEQQGQATDTAPYDEEHKKGPRDVNNVSWAIGKFFSCSFQFFVTNKVLRYEVLTTTTTIQPSREQGRAPGDPWRGTPIR